jgi:hypothetical protein
MMPSRGCARAALAAGSRGELHQLIDKHCGDDGRRPPHGHNVRGGAEAIAAKLKGRAHLKVVVAHKAPLFEQWSCDYAMQWPRHVEEGLPMICDHYDKEGSRHG